MPLLNVMEQIVRPRLDELLKNSDCCKCKKCYYDMLAISLNKLPPMYVNTKEGELFSKLSNVTFQKTVDIDIAVVSAINTVSVSPHHLEEDATQHKDEPESEPEDEVELSPDIIKQFEPDLSLFDTPAEEEAAAVAEEAPAPKAKKTAAKKKTETAEEL